MNGPALTEFVFRGMRSVYLCPTWCGEWKWPLCPWFVRLYLCCCLVSKFWGVANDLENSWALVMFWNWMKYESICRKSSVFLVPFNKYAFYHVDGTNFSKSAFRSVSVNTMSLSSSWGISVRKWFSVFNRLPKSFTFMMYGFFIVFVIHSFWVKKALSGRRVLNHSLTEYLKFSAVWSSLCGVVKVSSI